MAIHPAGGRIMIPAGSLTPVERRLLDQLKQQGISAGTATFATVMLVRRHVRPEPELLDLIATYPHLTQHDSRQLALEDARQRKWVIEIPSSFGGPTIIRAAANLPELISQFSPDIERSVTSALSRHTEVEVIGDMGDPIVYDSFSARLAEARTDIALPMVITSDKLSQVEVLKERASSGVNIRILLATADLAGEIRGRSSIPVAKERLRGWRNHSSGLRTFHVRVTRHRIDLRDASSVMIDRQLLRYDVYDDETQRSTEGTMLEVVAGGSTNLVRMFSDRFDDSWDRARPLGFWPTLAWAARRWWWAAGLLSLAAGLLIAQRDHPTVVSLVLGALLGYMLDRSGPVFDRIQRIWDRIRT